MSISAGVMDNTPSGEPPDPDDPFAARVDVRALGIWTTEVTMLDLLAELRPWFLRPSPVSIRLERARHHAPWAKQALMVPT